VFEVVRFSGIDSEQQSDMNYAWYVEYVDSFIRKHRELNASMLFVIVV